MKINMNIVKQAGIIIGTFVAGAVVGVVIRPQRKPIDPATMGARAVEAIKAAEVAKENFENAEKLRDAAIQDALKLGAQGKTIEELRELMKRDGKKKQQGKK